MQTPDSSYIPAKTYAISKGVNSKRKTKEHRKEEKQAKFEARKAMLLPDFQKGYSLQEIADKHHLTSNQVYGALRKDMAVYRIWKTKRFYEE